MADTKDLNDVFTNLVIAPSDEPLPEPTRGSTSGPNPFVAPLDASVEKETPYSIYIPKDAVQRAIFLINAAARKQNYGVRIVVNVKRDADGKIVKDAKGKAQPVPEKDGEHKGKVLVRFQGKRERKQQTAPRPYSVVKVKGEKAADGSDLYVVRRREDKAVLFRGTHEAAKTEYDRLKAEYANRVQTAPAATEQATEDAAQTPDAPTAPSAAPQPAAAATA